MARDCRTCISWDPDFEVCVNVDWHACPDVAGNCDEDDLPEGYEQIYDEPDDLELGFDPYLGCYTEDC